MTNSLTHSAETLACVFDSMPEIELAILIGSQATGWAHVNSDWDFAIRWRPDIDSFESLSLIEQLREKLSDCLGVSDEEIDLIDLARCTLTMRAVVAEEGVPLKGGDTLAWCFFLQRTWRELEDYYWEIQHAA